MDDPQAMLNVPGDEGSAAAGVVLVALATVGFGLNPLFARLAFQVGVPPDVATLARYLIPAAVVIPWMGWWRRASPRLALMAFGAGLFTGIGTVAYFRALDALPLPTVVAVYYTFPVFAALFGRLVFGIRVSPGQAAAILSVVAGAIIAVGPGTLGGPDWPLLLAALAAPLAWGWLLLVISLVLHPVPMRPQVGMIALGALVPVVLSLLLTGVEAGWEPTTSGVGWLLALGVLGVLVPAMLVTAGAPRAGPTTTGILGGLELVVALASGWLILNDPFTTRQAFGAAVLLGGSLWVAVRTSQASIV